MRLLLAAVTLAMVMVRMVEGGILPGTGYRCPPIIAKRSPDGQCIIKKGIKEKLLPELRKRHLRLSTHNCPYCAPGVIDVFPVWDDCSKFTLCFHGLSIKMSCWGNGGLFYNPFSRLCQYTSTVCRNRGVLFTTPGPVTTPAPVTTTPAAPTTTPAAPTTTTPAPTTTTPVPTTPAPVTQVIPLG